MKAADITDQEIIDAIRKTRGRNGVPDWATTWDVLEELKAYPPKVVMCKLRSCIKRKIIDGCACRTSAPRCRGDFELINE